MVFPPKGHLRFTLMLASLAALLLPAGAAETVLPPPHGGQFPAMTSGKTQSEREASLETGPELQRNRPARWSLAEHRRIDRALSALQPQRKGVVDTYVVAVALDSDAVFAREAREAGKLLSRRYGAAGRTIVLAGSTGDGPSELPAGSLTSLNLALARVAELIDPAEDVLILYSTSHGAPQGLTYHDGDEGFGYLTPRRYASVFNELGIRRRILIFSACYSGVFIRTLASPDTVLLTAASDSRPSFGCAADNDWTFFGDALINHALRKPQELEAAAFEAQGLIRAWESGLQVPASNPQASIGANVATWLKPLEARMPTGVTRPIGKPAIEGFDD